MANVDHFVFAEVTADSAWGCLFRIGRAEQIAHAGNCVFSFESKSHNGSFAHEFDDIGEKGLVADVGVVISKDGVIELHHLDATNPEALGLETSEHGANEIFLHSVRFEEDQGGFERRISGSHRRWGSRCDPIAQVFFQKLGLLFITLGKPVKRFSAKKIQRNRLSMAQKIQVVAPIPPFRFCKARPFRVFREVEPQFSFLVSCPQTDEFVNQGGAGE